MTAMQPDADLDAWIDQRLTEDDDSDTRWRMRFNGAGLARAVASANPYRYMQIKMTSEFAHKAWQVADARGLSRESLVRVLLADYIARVTGDDRDGLLAGMPPRVKGR
jgi:hypothetical protein